VWRSRWVERSCRDIFWALLWVVFGSVVGGSVFPDFFFQISGWGDQNVSTAMDRLHLCSDGGFALLKELKLSLKLSLRFGRKSRFDDFKDGFREQMTLHC